MTQTEVEFKDKANKEVIERKSIKRREKEIKIYYYHNTPF